MPPRPPQQIDRPFTVFISSSQSEFEEFRQGLKADLDNEKWSTLRPMRAILIENQRGPVIHDEIRKEIDRCSIYIGIFGRIWSEWTSAEFRYARSKDLPLMIYKVAKTPTKQRGRSTKVDSFLQSQAKQFGFRVRGPYKIERLEADIITDLVIQVSDMVRELSEIKKLTHPGLIL